MFEVEKVVMEDKSEVFNLIVKDRDGVEIVAWNAPSEASAVQSAITLSAVFDAFKHCASDQQIFALAEKVLKSVGK